MPILKTETPEKINGKIISRPSGNCPYFLMKLDSIPAGEEANEVTDTASFFAQYDLSQGEEEENVDLI